MNLLVSKRTGRPPRRPGAWRRGSATAAPRHPRTSRTSRLRTHAGSALYIIDARVVVPSACTQHLYMQTSCSVAEHVCTEGAHYRTGAAVAGHNKCGAFRRHSRSGNNQTRTVKCEHAPDSAHCVCESSAGTLCASGTASCTTCRHTRQYLKNTPASRSQICGDFYTLSAAGEPDMRQAVNASKKHAAGVTFMAQLTP